MFFLLAILFILPIFIRLLYKKHFSYAILFPTVLTYGLWYISSIIIIIFSISIIYYRYIFLIFPIFLLLFEIYKGIINFHKIKFNKYHVYILCFIFINTILVIFLQNTSIWDSSHYIKWAINGYQNGHYINNMEYSFNSFYYLAMIFGIYKMIEFYTIFIPYMYGIIFLLIILLIINQSYSNINKLIYMIPIIIATSFVVNYIGSLQLNWISGSIIAVFSIYHFRYIFKCKEIDYTTLFSLDLLILFLCNGSTTSILVAGIFVLVSKIILIIRIKNKKFVPIILSLILYIIILGFAHKSLNSINIIVKLILFVSVIVYLASLMWVYYIIRNDNVICLHNIGWKRINLNIWQNKKTCIIIFSFLLVLFIVISTILWSTNAIFVNNKSKLELQIYVVITWLFIMLIVVTSEWILFFIILLICIESILLLVLQKILPSYTTNYLMPRVLFSVQILPFLFWYILLINYVQQIATKKTMSYSIIKYVIPFVSVIYFWPNPISPISYYFSNSIFSKDVFNNKNINRKNFDFFMKYWNQINQKPDTKIFSDYFFPFVTPGTFVPNNYPKFVYELLYYRNVLNTDLDVPIYWPNHNEYQIKIKNEISYMKTTLLNPRKNNNYKYVFLNKKNKLTSKMSLHYSLVDSNNILNLYKLNNFKIKTL